jgi:phytoene synthase
MVMAPGFGWSREEWEDQLRKSSFAPGALLLDRQSRADLVVLYAFCRAIDDCADEFGRAEGRSYLSQWKKALAGRNPQAPDLVRELKAMADRRGLEPGLLAELIRGAESDLRPKVRFKDRRELSLYCHRVAGVVGVACLPLFGVDLAAGRRYAETLGRAFQLINILRDAAEDAGNGRLYFALSDLKRHGVSEREALSGHRMAGVLADYAAWARAELQTAGDLARALPKRGMRPSRMMRLLYGEILDQMKADGLKVYEKCYRLGRARKLCLVARGLFG